MPKLDVVPISEAKIRTPGRSRAEALREYIEFIEQLGDDQACRIQPSPGETQRTTMRRLGDAGRLSDKNLVIKKDGEAIYFWVKPPPKRGRPRKIFQES
jgi:hypothetical protein